MVHDLYNGGAAVAPVEAAFPGVTADGGEQGLTAGIYAGCRTVCLQHCRAVCTASRRSTTARIARFLAASAQQQPVGACPALPRPAAAISRSELSKHVVGNPQALRRLESIVHPLVAAEKARWLATQAAAGQRLVVLDIPLLYETGAEAECDAVAVVSAPAEAQRARALARPGMSEEKLAAILARQVPDAGKRRRADFVIDTVCVRVGQH